MEQQGKAGTAAVVGERLTNNNNISQSMNPRSYGGGAPDQRESKKCKNIDPFVQ